MNPFAEQFLKAGLITKEKLAEVEEEKKKERQVIEIDYIIKKWKVEVMAKLVKKPSFYTILELLRDAEFIFAGIKDSAKIIGPLFELKEFVDKNDPPAEEIKRRARLLWK